MLDTDDFDIDTSNGKLVLHSPGSSKAWGASSETGGGDAASSLPNSVPVISQIHQVTTNFSARFPCKYSIRTWHCSEASVRIQTFFENVLVKRRKPLASRFVSVVCHVTMVVSTLLSHVKRLQVHGPLSNATVYVSVCCEIDLASSFPQNAP